MSAWLFGPLFIGILLVLPCAALILGHRRLMNANLALVYSIGFGIGWYAALTLWQLAEFGLWKGFRPDQRTVANLVIRQFRILGMILIVTGASTMIFWGIVRFIRGPVVLWREGLCPQCGYDLTGNETGKCSECGTPIAPAANASGAEPPSDAPHV